MTLPGNINTITLTGTYLDSTGTPETGTISFTPPPTLVDINTAVMYSKAVTATLDSNGSFSVTLLCTDNPTLLPVGWNYTVTENIAGVRSYAIYLPSSLGSSTDISGRVPLPTLLGGTPLTPTSAVAPGYGALSYSQTWTGTQTFNGPVIFGSTTSFSSGGFANALTPTAVKTANYTGAANQLVPVNTTSGAVTITLPTAPADHTLFAVKIVILGTGNFVTVQLGGSDVFNKTGGSTSATLSLLGQGMLLQYSTTLGGWYVLSDDLPLTQIDARYAQLSNNLSDLPSTSTARTNLGLAAGATAALPLSIANGGTGQTTQATALTALAGTQASGQYLRSNGTTTALAAIVAGDVPTLNQNTTGTAAGLSSTLAIGSGGTGQTTQAAAITALAGTQTSGQYLRSNGTNTLLAAIVAADVPTLNQNTTGTAANITGTAAIANGGTGGTTIATAVANLNLGTTAGTGSTTSAASLTAIFNGPTIAANSIVAGSVFEFAVFGVMTTTVDTQTFSIGMYWGGTGGVAIVNATGINPNSSSTVTGVPWSCKGTLLFTSTTQAMCDLQVYMDYFLQNADSNGLVTVVTTSSKQIVVGAQASASAASMTCTAGYIQRLQ